MTADALRDRIAQVIESVAHEPGGRPCEPCVETADAVLGDWLRLVDESLQHAQDVEWWRSLHQHLEAEQ